MPLYLFDSLRWTARSWTTARTNVGPTDTDSGIHSGTQALKIRIAESCAGRFHAVELPSILGCGRCVLTPPPKKLSEATLMRNAFPPPRRQFVIV